MARKKHLGKYPLEYGKLLERAGSGATIPIACDSLQQAVNLRNDLYAYRSVLYTTNNKHLAELAGNCRFCIFGTILTIEPIRN